MGAVVQEVSLDGIVLRPLSSTLYPIVYRLEIQRKDRTLPEFLIDAEVEVVLRGQKLDRGTCLTLLVNIALILGK